MDGQPIKDPSNRIVHEDEIERALHYLAASARPIGRAMRNKVLTEKMTSHIEALMAKASEENAADKKKWDARASAKWLEAIEAEAQAAGAYEELKALREAASAKISAWQTEGANYRSMKI